MRYILILLAVCATVQSQVFQQNGIPATIGALSLTGAFTPAKKTKAQLDAITPAVGDIYTCSNCTVPYDLCVATGATLSGFRATINSAINTAIPGTLVAKGCGTNN